MFEGLTLATQRALEEARGWKPGYSALTYNTAEAVLFRQPDGVEEALDYEILDAERVTGAPDCVGKRQGKWGAYVKPTDPTARHAIQRGLKETFGWEVPLGNFHMVGIVGPWLHKATTELDGGLLVLTVHEDQAEQTPFEAKLFSVDVTDFEVGTEGGHAKATKDARWIKIRDLIAEQGQNKDYLYWLMVAMCFEERKGEGPRTYNSLQYISPGEYLY